MSLQHHTDMADDGRDHLIEERVAELEEEVERLRKQCSMTYCAYCGEECLVDDEAATKITEHIHTCAKHPMREKERRIAELEAINNANITTISNLEAQLADGYERGYYSEQFVNCWEAYHRLEAERERDRAILDAANAQRIEHQASAEQVARIHSRRPIPCNCGVCVAVRDGEGSDVLHRAAKVCDLWALQNPRK